MNKRQFIQRSHTNKMISHKQNKNFDFCNFEKVFIRYYYKKFNPIKFFIRYYFKKFNPIKLPDFHFLTFLFFYLVSWYLDIKVSWYIGILIS